MPGWISAFRVVPWGELLIAAPVVVKGARALWEAMRRQKAAPEAITPGDSLPSLEAQVDQLRKDLAESSAIVAALAEQNARLIEAIAILRTRTQILFFAGAVMVVALAWLALTR